MRATTTTTTVRTRSGREKDIVDDFIAGWRKDGFNKLWGKEEVHPRIEKLFKKLIELHDDYSFLDEDEFAEPARKIPPIWLLLVLVVAAVMAVGMTLTVLCIYHDRLRRCNDEARYDMEMSQRDVHEDDTIYRPPEQPDPMLPFPPPPPSPLNAINTIHELVQLVVALHEEDQQEDDNSLEKEEEKPEKEKEKPKKEEEIDHGNNDKEKVNKNDNNDNNEEEVDNNDKEKVDDDNDNGNNDKEKVDDDNENNLEKEEKEEEEKKEEEEESKPFLLPKTSFLKRLYK